MKPDLKNSGEDEGRRRGRGPLWFLAGVIVAVALIIAVPSIRHALKHVKTVVTEQAAASKGKHANAPAAKSAGTSTSGFDFYRLLSHPTQILTSGESDEVKTPPANSGSVTQPGAYVLQVASVRNAKDAEALKAQLALWGIRAEVQTVNVQGDTWHRVRIGPVNDLQALNALRDKLDAHKLHPLLIRVGN
ncbi:MAG: SPOR domain-containing protein [Gammaproteobacteria bacterium]